MREQIQDVLIPLGQLIVFLLLQVLPFGVITLELEMDEGVALLDFIHHHIVVAVPEFTSPDFQLLDIAQAAVLGTFADCKHAVKEVIEFLAAGEIVLGNGT